MTLWRIRASVDDRPGYLAVLAASLALRAVNILSVEVHATEAGAVDDFLVDAPDSLTAGDLAAAVHKGRGRDAWIGLADARGLVDPPTRLLGLAERLVHDPEELTGALVSLLGDCEISWGPEPHANRSGFSVHRLLLPDPSGGTIRVSRAAPPFTPAEYARAHALAEIAGTVARQAGNRSRALLRDGSEIGVRPAGADDSHEVQALYAACSRETRRRRHGGTGPDDAALPALVRRMLTPNRGHALLAEAGPDATPIALATIVYEGVEAEIGLIVADAWQRRGVGALLLRRLIKLAEAAGVEAVHAHTQPDNAGVLRTMRGLDLPLRTSAGGPVITVSADLAGTHDRNPVGEQPVKIHDRSEDDGVSSRQVQHR